MAVDAAPPLLIFSQAVLLGLSAGLVYDLLRALRLRLPRLTAPLDILYCLTAGAAAFLFILRRAQGQLRVYMLLGAAGGVWLFFRFLARPLRPVWDFWVDTLAFLLHLAAVPAERAAAVCKKIG